MPDGEPKPTFEEGLSKLEGIVKQLEGGELSLEESVKLFEQGVALSNTCRKQIREAETKVEILLKKGSEVVAEPFTSDMEEEDPFRSRRQ